MNTTPDISPQGVDLVSAALVECQGKLKSAHMDATNPFFKSRYATLGAVIEASREALYGAGLYLQQTLALSDGVVSVHTLIRHKSGQFIDGGTMSLPIGENERNSDAQLAGSIATYLRRYAWSSVLGIYADSDDDGNEAPKGAVARQVSRPHQDTTQGVKTPPGAAKATTKHLLAALNNLKAAPGQENVGLFEGYLRSKGWIDGTQTTMDFPIQHVPITKEDMLELEQAVQRYETTMRSEIV